ncbi:hypothetical protein PR202_gb17230 [Eleusine coracana subsp. coracana]|uniref:Trichome birefringence-like N-terminal domain-containing protein n=1 Tax=Eleusine coracana subsp. coracana TaxID=191504 RepID=A0AAV5F3Y1_ELECO|nr:hypothetical protein PR202_gb17230 [Eleusine coracana subsp. coracana]
MQKKLTTKLANPAAAALTALALLTIVFLLSTRRPNPSLVSYGSSATTSHSSASTRDSWQRGSPERCDIFRGEWVPDDSGALPYYTNLSCPLIQEHQNCMKYGRPDRGFLQWRWRPAGCEMPRFDAEAFLDTVRGRSMAFVGDSLARNHMQSLMCLLTKVELPKDVSTTPNHLFRTMRYESYNFTLSVFWSPFLVVANQSSSSSEEESGRSLWNLYLDELDGAWTARIAAFDYVVLSASNWFHKPAVFHESGRVAACHDCLLPDVPDLTRRYSLRMALRAALRFLTDDGNFNGTVIMRTESPMHFEGGEWDKGGDCRRKRPYKAGETRMTGWDLDFHTLQMEEFATAKAEAEAEARNGARLVLMDTTEAMLQRPDGHPSRYGHWPNENVTLYNDCVHWCLPGPVDAWNEMLQQMLFPRFGIEVGFLKPDLGFLKWRWRHDGCDLPRLDPARFLAVMRGKSMAFVGDSLARNHMQSLICLLTRVEKPTPNTPRDDGVYRFDKHNFTVANFWAPFLVRHEMIKDDGPAHTGLWNLYLDEPDPAWASSVAAFDYVVVSASSWFYRPAMLYEAGTLVGCYYCLRPNVTDLTLNYALRMATRTTLRYLGDNGRGTAVLRTVSPSQYENGEWNKDGDCVRTRPYERGEKRIQGFELDFHKLQLEEFAAAEEAARAAGGVVRMMLMDTTEAMVLRADAHPSKYRGYTPEKQDCVHWCLPGAIDAWNDMLLHMLTTGGSDDSYFILGS